MKHTIVVPALGESVVEARIAHWLKKEGESVDIGDVLVELETEKVNVEVAAQNAGVLAKIIAREEDTVHIGDTIGEIDTSAQTAVSQTSREVAETSEARKAPVPAKQPVEHEEKAETTAREKATPLAKRVAEVSGLEISAVSGSGAGGRVTKHDVESFLSHKTESAASNRSEAGASKPENGRQLPAPSAPKAVPLERKEREERVRMSLRRKTIARRMVEAQQSAAMLTTFNEVDMNRVMELRKKYKENFKEKYGVNLGIVSFYVKAVIAALKEFPRLNAEIDGDDILYKYYYDIGVAIGAEEGLVVPVLRNADHMSFAEIEMGIKNYAEKSSKGALTLDDLRGGTFTITNGGVFGSMMSTPILNPPQVGILGLHKIAERPVVENGQLVVRPMMYVALTYDHRIVDGRESVQFLVKVKELVEDPATMLFE
ncbi:MAG: 2-oxoglutarate dehydrogenase complex dihydrolipoyllysine-residue succinyltransferase [Bacteroidetes bacterium]|nr:2-oxoglutarate dehydrogenase complex dihydrolipoyllysine-residue succinyltransferase [Bacteroidota bacterium]MCL5267652.1 2-oxoglutarate dehydrogenase complex dihydrolipoyllysine-residue succinyltransferase [Bacteroidota bacterium]